MNKEVDILAKPLNCGYSFDNITVLKVFAALAIFILHEGVKHEWSLIVSLMRFAVPLFFYMSAIIYGTRRVDYFDGKFFLKRLRSLSNIYIPYVLYTCLLLILCLDYPIVQVAKQTIIDLLYLSGLCPSFIPICGHLWFLTYLIIFYGLLIGVSYILKKNDKYRKIITYLLLILFVVNTCLTHVAKIYYLIGYLLLFLNSNYLLDATKKSRLVKIALLFIGLVLLSMPIFLPPFDDGNLTGCLAAVLIILGTNYTFNTPRFLKRLSKMSMAFYLVHQILVCEINSILLALFISLLLSVIFTEILNIEFLRKIL